jgi:primosomal protein N' (replication factor Y)
LATRRATVISACRSRVGEAQLPEIAAVDLRRTPPERGRWLAPPLVEAITARLEAGEQSLLFLNRRGYAPLTLCGACGHKVTCPNCDSWMVMHRPCRTAEMPPLRL